MVEALKIEYSRRVREESLSRIEKCLSMLNEEQVWRKGPASANSIGNLILHLAGNIRQYMISAVGGEKDIRQRDKEFTTSASKNKSELLSELSDTINKSILALSRIKDKDLDKVINVQVFEESILSIIIHVIEHTSYHTGQISLLTKQMLDVDLGYYEDYDL